MFDEEMMTSQDVADFLKINLRKVYELRVAGEIPAHKVGGSYRFIKSEIIAWVKEQE